MASCSTAAPTTTATLVGGKLHIDGFMYLRSGAPKKGRVYWECRKLRSGECTARATTSVPTDRGEVIVYRQSPHTHAPSREAVAAEEILQKVKRKATEHPEQPPAQLLRSELGGVPDAVLSQLPDQVALAQSVRRARRRDLPANPTKLSALGELPEVFQKTLLGENFLLYDSGAPQVDDESEDEDEPEPTDDEEAPVRKRVLVFGTRRNVELLCQSRTWFIDGTFRTAPHIFTQIFTIQGLRRRAGKPDEESSLPFIYALLTSKKKEDYAEVLRAVRDATAHFNVAHCNPQRIMSDFELSIIQACREVYPQVPIATCFFHLSQSIFRQIQQKGLQVAYNDECDRRLRNYTHMLTALAFVPVGDVEAAFEELRSSSPPTLRPIMDYFAEYYVLGRQVLRRGRSQRASLPPRFSPELWNHYNTALRKEHRTNNCAEGWHNRFSIVVGKNHPDLYSCLIEFQKEQSYTEASVAELALGKRIKSAPKRQWSVIQDRVQNIVQEYDDHKANDTVLDYLRTLGHNIQLH